MKRSIRGTVGSLLIAAAASICVGQMAASTQVNTRVAGTGSDATFRYANQSTSRMMPSEMRYQYYKSGMLAGEVRGNYARLGPMTNMGQQAYFNDPKRVAPSAGVDSRVDTLVRPNIPSVSAGSSSGNGSLRYSGASAVAKPARNLAAPKVSGGAKPLGSVRYDSRVR
jgi:hypothetical protein